MLSLRQRLLGIGLLAVVFFAVGIGFALDFAFREVAETLRIERLQAQVYMLLASADLEEGRLKVPEILPEPRLSAPGSGVYALFRDSNGQPVWRSGSLLGQEYEINLPSELGAFTTGTISAEDVSDLFVMSYGVAWVVDEDEFRFDLMVAENQHAFYKQIYSFRQALWGWLVLFIVLLLAVLMVVLHWAISPLRRAELAVLDVAAGRAERIDSPFPRELAGLVENLNRLINNERQRMTHYRETLANLAHSLKTPLAVIKNTLESHSTDDQTEMMIEQVERMNTLIEYQLARASASGKMTFQTPLSIRPVLDKLLRSLHKVYAAKQVWVECECAESAVFLGVEGDLMEITGNLLDNAFKWCRKRVSVTVTVCEASPVKKSVSKKPSVLQIRIEDDGPGMSDDDVSRFSERGVRGDESVPGQGIGLAVVRERVHAYDGRLEFGQSRWNGAAVMLFIPLS